MLKILLVLLMLFASQSFAEPRLRPANWSVAVIGSKLNNFYWVADNIYRSEQPDESGLQAYSKLGIAEILNLRDYHEDDDAKEENFIVSRVPMGAGSVNEEQIAAALDKIKNRKGALVIHCWHGSDRTGATVAAYRIVFQNWTKAQALDEMVNGGYGYHASAYPNLVELINKLDVAKIKRQLQLKL